MKNKKHLMTVLNARHQDCSNRGITVKIDKSYIHVWIVTFNGRFPNYHDAIKLANSSDCDFMGDDDLIVATPYGGTPSLDNPPVAKWVGAIRKGHWTMFGGNFVYTSNGITHTALCGYSAPLSVHDRVEH